MDFLDELNPEQREAVLQVDGPLLILAGAGSGKTRVIAYRVAYLIGAGHADPREVVAVTFTNKAAEEMRQRVTALLGDAATGAWVSTFHSMCARLLRREAPALGLSRDFVIYDSSDQLAAIKQAMREMSIDDTLVQPRAALSRISHAKNLCLGPESFAGSYNPHDAQIGRLFERYQQALDDSHALDFDDLLLKTVELFDKPDIRSRYADRFRFLLVDEYQDTNRPQYLLMRQLAAHHRNLTVVGDPDQSIYAWRGADIRNILDFEKDYPEAAVVRLEQNYRSTKTILAAANHVVANNADRKPKTLWTANVEGEAITRYLASDERDEARFVVDEIERLLSEEHRSYADFAVFYRTNAQSRVIEDQFLRSGVPYQLVGGTRFFERAEIRDVMAYLRAVVNPADPVAVKRVINQPKRGIGLTTIGVLEDVAYRERITLSQVIDRSGGENWLSAGPRAKVAAFAELINGMRAAEGDTMRARVERIVEMSGLISALAEEHTDEARGRIDNIREFFGVVDEFDTAHPDAEFDALFRERVFGSPGKTLTKVQIAPFQAPHGAGPASCFKLRAPHETRAHHLFRRTGHLGAAFLDQGEVPGGDDRRGRAWNFVSYLLLVPGAPLHPRAGRAVHHPGQLGRWRADRLGCALPRPDLLRHRRA